MTYGVVFSMAAGHLPPLLPDHAGARGGGAGGHRGGGALGGLSPGGWQAGLLPVALLVTAVWQMKVLARTRSGALWLTPLAFGGSVLAAVPLVVTRLLGARVWRRWAPGLVATRAWWRCCVAPAGLGGHPGAGRAQQRQPAAWPGRPR